AASVPLPAPSNGLSSARRWSGLAIATAGLPLLTVVLVGARGTFSLGSILLLFLLADVVVAAVGGLWPGVLAACASLFAANWFLTPPFHTLAVESRDSIVELVVFAVVALIVSFAVELAARDRERAGRLELEGRLLARLARQPASEVSLPQVLEQVRELFGMSTAALVRQGAGGPEVVAHVGESPGGEPSAIRVAAGGDLFLVAHGPRLFAEDRRVLERLAATAARAWESQILAAHATALAETDRVRSALLAAVSHDLRTPLAGVKAAVGSLRQSDVTWSEQEHAELLATIEDSADRLTDLISNLLDMSRLQAGGVTAQRVPVAIDEVVSRALLDIPSQGLQMDVPDDLPLVLADPGLLERVVANLVDNARRYSPVGRPVEVAATTTGGTVVLTVRDHGPGVPHEHWTTMFAPFQRVGAGTAGTGGGAGGPGAGARPAAGAAPAAAAGTGSGLGLAIVEGFCQAMEMVVRPADTPGGGLTMTVEMATAS
ncbi:MAG TPA: DUF4118 domain-containing protein, partial [Actinotalea sp.]